MTWLEWLPDVLRDEGLTVHLVAGWRNRSAAEDPDASTFRPSGIIVHETRSPRIADDATEINVLVNGRVGLSGPIAQLYLSRTGEWYVVAAGLCHHVKTGWDGPYSGWGNTRLLGIEPAHTVAVDATGARLETWANKQVQYWSYVRGVGAIRRYTGWLPPVGHKEHQPGDKPDPEFSMDTFRAHVGAALLERGGHVQLTQSERDRYAYNLDRVLSAILAGQSVVTDVVLMDGSKREFPLAFPVGVDWTALGETVIAALDYDRLADALATRIQQQPLTISLSGSLAGSATPQAQP